MNKISLLAPSVFAVASAFTPCRGRRDGEVRKGRPLLLSPSRGLLVKGFAMKWSDDRDRKRDRNERRWFTLRQNWPIDSPIKQSQALKMSVAAVEAAGSVQEAVRVGMLRGTPRVIEFI